MSNSPSEMTRRQVAIVIVIFVAIGMALTQMGCARVPGAYGDAYFVGTVNYSTGNEGCVISKEKSTLDGGKGDEQADATEETVLVYGFGPNASCVAGGGISDNLKAMGTFILGLLL